MEAIPLEIVASGRRNIISAEVSLAHKEINSFRTYYHRESRTKPDDLILLLEPSSTIVVPKPQPCYWHNLVVHHAVVLRGTSQEVARRHGEILYVCGELGALSAVFTIMSEQYKVHNITHVQNFGVLVGSTWTTVRIGYHIGGWTFEFLT